MRIRNHLRKIAGTAILTAGLAYPACAAVCPKGIGGCTAPGRCFLYVDADRNSLCDYTGRTSSQVTPNSGSFQSGTNLQVQAGAVPDPTPTQAASGTVSSSQSAAVTKNAAIVQTSGSEGVLGALHIPVFLAEILIFLALLAVCFILIRKGLLGTAVRETRPALALSALFALPVSLMATSVLAGNVLPGTVFAIIYMVAAPLLIAYLWVSGVITQRIVLLMAGLSTLTGFVFVAPVMPLELGGLISAIIGTTAITAVIIVLGMVIASTLVIGRTFCSCTCPVGSLQELCYEVPVRKILIRQSRTLEFVRFAIFAATAVAAAFAVDLLAFSGLYDLFSLTLSAGFGIAIGLVVLSIFLYRPICRILCPFGVLFSVFAEFSRFRLRRTPECIRCSKCERACPVSIAGAHDSRRECYLCGRCRRACPKEQAIRYSP